MTGGLYLEPQKTWSSVHLPSTQQIPAGQPPVTPSRAEPDHPAVADARLHETPGPRSFRKDRLLKACIEATPAVHVVGISALDLRHVPLTSVPADATTGIHVLTTSSQHLNVAVSSPLERLQECSGERAHQCLR